MSKNKNFSWTSALVGAAAATTAAIYISSKPKPPTFHLFSIDLTSLKHNLDAELILNVHVTNPNVVPIRYSDTDMSIFYNGSKLGSASVKAGSQKARSCQLLRLPARLSGLQLAQHGKRFLDDVAKREIVLGSTVEIKGKAKVLWWENRFNVNVDSRVVVDPVFLHVINQDNDSKLKMFYLGDAMRYAGLISWHHHNEIQPNIPLEPPKPQPQTPRYRSNATACNMDGIGSHYECSACNFDLHLHCALPTSFITHLFYEKCEKQLAVTRTRIFHKTGEW